MGCIGTLCAIFAIFLQKPKNSSKNKVYELY